jgi:hypothetical protein
MKTRWQSNIAGSKCHFENSFLTSGWLGSEYFPTMLRLGCSVAASALLTAATNAMAATNGGVCKKPARVVATVARGFQEFWSALEVPAKARIARHAKRIILAVSTQG